MRTRVLVGVTLMCSLFVAAACSTSDGTPEAITAQAEDRLPFSTLSEARTFADYWVTATVVDEWFEQPEGGDNSEGYVPRTVTLMVDKTWWHNDAYGDADAISSRFELAVLGHALHDNKSVPLAMEGAPFIRVGSSYLFGLVVDARGEPALPSPRAALALKHGTVSALPDANPEGTIADDLEKMGPRRAVDVILDAPLLVANQSLSPKERYDRLLAEGG